MSAADDFNNVAQKPKPRPGELIDAVFYKDIRRVRELLERGADPNDRGGPGTRTLPPLMTAITSFLSMEMVDLLIDNGADVNISNDRGVPAVLQAVFNNVPDVLVRLLEGGADPDKKTPQGFSALYFAKRDNKTEMAEILEKASAEKARASLEEQKQEAASHIHDLLRAHAPKLIIRPSRKTGGPDDDR